MSNDRRPSESMLLRNRAEEISKLLAISGTTDTWRALLHDLVLKSEIYERDVILQVLGNDFAAIALNPLRGLSFTQISVLYEFSLAHASQDSRKVEGQYFTPQDVADFMAVHSKQFPKDAIWLDPCCGVGNLTAALARASDSPAEFLATNVRLVDKDPLALVIAQVLLTLEFNVPGLNLFEALQTASNCMDALEGDLPEFDYAILNPPYLVVPANDKFSTSKCRDLYAYFLETVMAQGKGLIAVTPQSFTSAGKFSTLRSLLASSPRSFRIYCFDNVPDGLFRGFKFGSKNSNKVNSTRAAVIVLGNSVDINCTITPLLRWKAGERALLFQSAGNYLVPFIPSPQPFPKLHEDQVAFHQELSLVGTTLEGVVSSQETEFFLDVATTPRYFLSAVRRNLARGAKIRLYFSSASDLDRAYLLLNSSVAYWWWRTHDGGITLNRGTLLSTPWITDFELDDELLNELLESEQTNLVKKTNAGLINENVKHSPKLLALLNQHVARGHGEALMITHSNSLSS